MVEFIVEYCTVITHYGCLIIYALALTLGIVQLIIWLAEMVIRKTIGAKNLYAAYAQYLKTNDTGKEG